MTSKLVFLMKNVKQVVNSQAAIVDFGTACTVVSDYMSLYECIMSPAVVCNQWDMFLCLKYARIAFVLVVFNETMFGSYYF